MNTGLPGFSGFPTPIRRIQIETHDFANKPLNKSNPLSSEGAARAAGAVESAPKSEL